MPVATDILMTVYFQVWAKTCAWTTWALHCSRCRALLEQEDCVSSVDLDMAERGELREQDQDLICCAPGRQPEGAWCARVVPRGPPGVAWTELGAADDRPEDSVDFAALGDVNEHMAAPDGIGLLFEQLALLGPPPARRGLGAECLQDDIDLLFEQLAASGPPSTRRGPAAGLGAVRALALEKLHSDPPGRAGPPGGAGSARERDQGPPCAASCDLERGPGPASGGCGGAASLGVGAPGSAEAVRPRACPDWPRWTLQDVETASDSELSPLLEQEDSVSSVDLDMAERGRDVDTASDSELCPLLEQEDCVSSVDLDMAERGELREQDQDLICCAPGRQPESAWCARVAPRGPPRVAWTELGAADDRPEDSVDFAALGDVNEEGGDARSPLPLKATSTGWPIGTREHADIVGKQDDTWAQPCQGSIAPGGAADLDAAEQGRAFSRSGVATLQRVDVPVGIRPGATADREGVSAASELRCGMQAAAGDSQGGSPAEDTLEQPGPSLEHRLWIVEQKLDLLLAISGRRARQRRRVAEEREGSSAARARTARVRRSLHCPPERRDTASARLVQVARRVRGKHSAAGREAAAALADLAAALGTVAPGRGAARDAATSPDGPAEDDGACQPQACLGADAPVAPAAAPTTAAGRGGTALLAGAEPGPAAMAAPAPAAPDPAGLPAAPGAAAAGPEDTAPLAGAEPGPAAAAPAPAAPQPAALPAGASPGAGAARPPDAAAPRAAPRPEDVVLKVRWARETVRLRVPTLELPSVRSAVLGAAGVDGASHVLSAAGGDGEALPSEPEARAELTEASWSGLLRSAAASRPGASGAAARPPVVVRLELRRAAAAHATRSSHDFDVYIDAAPTAGASQQDR
ncbi:unnamed protein product [Prorocentrum cordatum]|uniref:Uncharacterized protein n=1 Tax=Prorocentrum cordatum TaxID=2364126 RepID=A0ABN9QNE9_9DINO|nr:unnamed protein product [Polarella glacialis]